MAINKKLIHFNKKEDFEREVANGNILDRSIVFIKDTKEIYTHGTIYGGNSSNGGVDIEWSVIEDSILSDGVYAVTSTGKLVDYKTTDDYENVAIVAGSNKFIISNEIVKNNYSNKVVWGANFMGYDVDGNLEVITPEETNLDEFSSDYTTWTEYPMADFNGKSNTQAMFDAYEYFSVDMNNMDICKALGEFNDSELSAGRANDWYIPSMGQLALIYKSLDEINEALSKIGAEELGTTSYWSSSEYDAASAWQINFYNGNIIRLTTKNGRSTGRFIRDI